MLRRLRLVVALTCAVLISPSVPVGAAQDLSSDGDDVIVGTGSVVSDPINFFEVQIIARSGSNGEHPQGAMTFVSGIEGPLWAHVRCVRAVGSNAMVTGDLGPHFAGGLRGMGLYIEDRTSLGQRDRIYVFFFAEIIDPANACQVLPFRPDAVSEIVAGDFTVRDS